MNFYDVLAAEKWGGGVPTTNFFDLLFAQSISGGQWETYEGTIPATFNANGDDMRQYQIYGSTGGVGDDSGTAYGYKLDMAIGSNILQSSEIEWGGWQAAAETIPSKIVNPARCRSKNMYPISGEKIFYDFKSLNVNIAFVNSDELSLGGTGFKTGVGSVDVPANAVKCLFIIANTDSSANIIPAQVIAAEIWASVDATITPIYIGDTPLGEDEYVDYEGGKVYRRTAQVMPSAPAETKTQNGITVTCDGEGRYSISGTATANVIFNFDISEFVIPTSVGNGGNGTFSMFNDFASQNFKLGFRYNNTLIDDWSAYPVNRTSTGYSLMGNKTTNGISISVMSNTTINGTILPILTDDGILPETYIPYLQPTDPPVPLPALPTCDGETVVDYAGESVAQPEKVLLEYKKRGGLNGRIT